MTTSVTPLTKLAAWQALEAHYTKVREVHLRQLFADDPKRGERMTAEAIGIYFDYSKHRITDETMKLLLQLAGNLACGSASMPCSGERGSTSQRSGPSCT